MDSVLLWLLAGLLAWVVVALAVGVVAGGSIRLADRVEAQEQPDGSTAPGVPAPVAALPAPV